MLTATVGAPAHSGTPFLLSAAAGALDPNLASHSASAAGVIRRSFAISSTRGAKPRAQPVKFRVRDAPLPTPFGDREIAAYGGLLELCEQFRDRTSERRHFAGKGSGLLDRDDIDLVYVSFARAAPHTSASNPHISARRTHGPRRQSGEGSITCSWAVASVLPSQSAESAAPLWLARSASLRHLTIVSRESNHTALDFHS